MIIDTETKLTSRQRQSLIKAIMVTQFDLGEIQNPTESLASLNRLSDSDLVREYADYHPGSIC